MPKVKGKGSREALQGADVLSFQLETIAFQSMLFNKHDNTAKLPNNIFDIFLEGLSNLKNQASMQVLYIYLLQFLRPYALGQSLVLIFAPYSSIIISFPGPQ